MFYQAHFRKANVLVITLPRKAHARLTASFPPIFEDNFSTTQTARYNFGNFTETLRYLEPSPPLVILRVYDFSCKRRRRRIRRRRKKGEDSSTMDIKVDSLVKSALLRKVREEGGFMYAMLAEKAAKEGDADAAEAAREMAWEQLHSGPWHNVVPAWRDAYAMACLYVATFKARTGEYVGAIRVLDMGVIMGGEALRKELDSAIKEIKEVLERKDGENGVERWDFGKKMSLEEVRQILPFRSLSRNIVQKQFIPSMERFLCDYFLAGSPVILTGCIGHWPACTKWKDIKYLKKIAGERTVPVEVGKNYLCPEWKQELITFSEFLERIESKECCPAKLTYLAQYTLFDQIQELRNDIMIPDYCFTGGGELQSLNAWFGPAGTVTPLHHDPHHNLFAQVVGRKYIRLYPAFVSEDLYPYSETMLSNSSQVDLDNVDAKVFPKVQELDFVDCVLEEGEMLYIPPKWWHYVRSLTTSLSVSFWWAAKDLQAC